VSGLVINWRRCATTGTQSEVGRIP